MPNQYVRCRQIARLDAHYIAECGCGVRPLSSAFREHSVEFDMVPLHKRPQVRLQCPNPDRIDQLKGMSQMGRPIDDIDRAIIACLQDDSRTPSAEIARHVGVAERTVRARIDRLVQDDVVRLVGILHPQALGYRVVADVFLEVEIGRIQEVARHVAEIEEVGYVGLTTGDRDISLQLFAPSVDALYDFVTERLNRIPGVLRAKTFVIPRVIKSSHHWKLPANLPDQEQTSAPAPPHNSRRAASRGGRDVKRDE